MRLPNRPGILVALAQCDDEADVERLVQAGATEFYVGYLPPSWRRRWGFEASANRRTAPHQHVLDERRLVRLARAARAAGAGFQAAFNPLSFSPEQLEALRPLVDTVERLEPDAYILASPAVALAFRRWGVRRPFAASVGMGLINVEAVAFAAGLGFRRVVLSPRLSLRETAGLCRAVAARKLAVGFEAFASGAGCVFGGDSCFTLHGYGLPAFCHSRTPPRLQLLPGPGRFDRRRAAQAVTRRPPRLRCALGAVPFLARLPGMESFKVPGRGRDEGDPLRWVARLRELLDGRRDAADACAAGIEGGRCPGGPRCYYRLEREDAP